MTGNSEEIVETTNEEVMEESAGEAETKNAGEQTAEETDGEVTEQTETAEEIESTEEQVTDDTNAVPAEGTDETEENTDVDDAVTENSEETVETTNEEVTEESAGEAETETAGEQTAEETDEAVTEPTEETESTEEEVTDDTTAAVAEGTGETEESTGTEGAETKNGGDTSETTAVSDGYSSNGGRIETAEEEQPIEKKDNADTVVVLDHKTGSTYSEYAEGRTKPGEALDFVRDKDARGGFLIKDGNRWREMTDEEYNYYVGTTKQAELDQLQEKLSINASFDQQVAEYRREGKEVYDLERQRAEALEKLDQKYKNSFDAVERVKEYHKLKEEGKDVAINNNQINDIDAEIVKLKSPESVSTETNVKHTFDDWVNTNNYDENGNYVGKGKDWGYKPYDKDDSELEDKLQSPAQQNITEYMKQHNYGKDDYAEYSRDPEWQHLNAELKKEEVNNNIEAANRTSAQEYEFNKKQIDSIGTEVERSKNIEHLSYQEAKLIQERAEKELTDIETKKKDLQDDAVKKFDNVLKLQGTDEYKAALADYNATKQQIEDIKTEQDNLHKELADIEFKKLKLREEEIRKGEMAAAASAATLVAVANLEKDHNNEFNSQKPNHKKLEEIRLKNEETIEQLTQHKKAIDQAIEAKQDEISEYVNRHNMDRHNTENDPYYKELVSEYESLKNTRSSLKNGIEKLENNNKEAEIRQATLQFEQSNWECKDAEERGKAIREFAEYNAKRLGLETVPEIVYYHNENPNDHGYCIPEKNVIYVNDYNAKNGADVVDTIAHESRHLYQFKRAALAETETDIAFKNNFDHYKNVEEDDYDEYLNQAIEKDARDYALQYTEVLNKHNNTVGDTNGASVKGGNFADLTKLNDPAVESVAQQDQVIRSYKQSDRGIEKTENVRLTEIEVKEIKEFVGPHYENSKRIANNITEFNTYKEHFDIIKGHKEKYV